MSWPPKRATIYVHKLIGDKAEQGVWCATGEVGDYKTACSNAMQMFVRDLHPPAGRYMIYAVDQPYPPDEGEAPPPPESYNGKGSSLIFEVKYPVAVIECNDRQEIVGGDYLWSSYAIQSDPQWGPTSDFIKPKGDTDVARS